MTTDLPKDPASIFIRQFAAKREAMCHDLILRALCSSMGRCRRQIIVTEAGLEGNCYTETYQLVDIYP